MILLDEGVSVDVFEGEAAGGGVAYSPAAFIEAIFFLAESEMESAPLFLHSFHCSSAYSCTTHLVVMRFRCDNSRWIRRNPEPATKDPTRADGM